MSNLHHLQGVVIVTSRDTNQTQKQSRDTNQTQKQENKGDKGYMLL